MTTDVFAKAEEFSFEGEKGGGVKGAGSLESGLRGG